jgi:energy-coupling factor transport system substrate-specific component
VGNFFYGLVAYKLCGKLGPLSSKEPMEARTGRQIVEYLLLALLASVACAAFISWGVDLFGLVPFGVLGPVISLNNFMAAAIIGPFLLRLLYPRAKRWNILWTDIMEPDEISQSSQPWIGALLMWIGGIGALVVGVLVSTGLYASLPFQFGSGSTGLATVIAILPLLVVFVIGCLLA